MDTQYERITDVKTVKAKADLENNKACGRDEIPIDFTKTQKIKDNTEHETRSKIFTEMVRKYRYNKKQF